MAAVHLTGPISQLSADIFVYVSLLDTLEDINTLLSYVNGAFSPGVCQTFLYLRRERSQSDFCSVVFNRFKRLPLCSVAPRRP